jgi:hypothetical protein
MSPLELVVIVLLILFLAGGGAYGLGNILYVLAVVLVVILIARAISTRGGL